jgi:hypothetical protein
MAASNKKKENAMSVFGFITTYFRAGRSTDDHRPIWRIWVTDGEEATYINPLSGRVHAYVWHDGYGKLYPTIILPFWRALPLIWRREGVVASLLPFPRVAMEFRRVKSRHIEAAQEYVEYLLSR